MKIQSRLLSVFGLVLALASVLNVFTYRTTLNSMESNKWVDHTYVVMAAANSALADLVNMETGLRGFMISGKDEFLEPYNSGKIGYNKRLDELEKLTSDNPAQVGRWQAIREQAQAWDTQFVAKGIALRRQMTAGQVKFEEVSNFNEDGGGKPKFDRMRAIFADAIGAEQTLLVKRLEDNANSNSQLLNIITWGGIGLIVLGLALAIMIARSLTRPIATCVTVMEKLAQGDLTAQVGLKRSDELGTLSTSIDTSITNLRTLVSQLGTTSSALQQSSISLSETSHSQAASSEETTVQAYTVASAGEELSINAKTMSESASQITQSTTTVAAAMEEMSSSIQEVARNCAQESAIARKADTQARATRELMAKLDDSARQIGKVVELINRIAEQTNLLALNATIEAASAGEAGRGFAVVANEVKELARQSAAATEDIRKQVALIQDGAGSSMRSLDEVAKIIEQVSHISSSIAAAVEQQSATTSEIVGTIHNVSTATGTLSKNVQQTSEGAAEVARNISGVSEAAAEGAKGATRISASATELNALSNTLGQLVAKFKI